MQYVKKNEVSEIRKEKITAVCIDDFAIKKGNTYGTIMVDIESRKIIDIINTREADAVRDWLLTFPSLCYVSRDGSPTYKKAITQTNKNITQISDRFHLLKGLTDAAKKYITDYYKENIDLSVSILGKKDRKSTITWVEDIKYKDIKTNSNILNIEKRSILIESARNLQKEGYDPKEIAKMLGVTAATIRNYLKSDSHLTSSWNMLKPYIKDIKLLVSKRTPFKETEKIIRKKGYKGSTSAIRGLTAQERKLRKISKKRKVKTLKRKYLVSLLYKPIEQVKEISQEQLDKILNANPVIGKVFDIVKMFKETIMSNNVRKLDVWINKAKRLEIGEINQFINGINRDMDAVKNAIKYDLSNGIAEGKVNKLKVIKRIMYGRCAFFLLRKKLLLLENRC